MMTFFPEHLRSIPSWLRMYGVFSVSYGSRGGANRYHIALWQIRLKGAIYLIPVILIFGRFLAQMRSGREHWCITYFPIVGFPNMA